MTGIIQRNCKGLRAIYEEVRFLMNRFQISCICLQEVMLENIKYNLGREYEFYTTIPPSQRSKRGATVSIINEMTRKKLNIRTTLQVVALEVYMTGKRKRRICLIYLSPIDSGGYERSHGAAPSTYNTSGSLQCRQPTMGK